MSIFREFIQTAAVTTAGNVAGATASQIIQQLDPATKTQWDRIVGDFPRLYAFLGEMQKASGGTWKVTPAQFTTLLNKAVVGMAGSYGSAMTAPLSPR